MESTDAFDRGKFTPEEGMPKIAQIMQMSHFSIPYCGILITNTREIYRISMIWAEFIFAFG